MENGKSELLQTASNFIFKVEDDNLELVRIEPALLELDLILIESSLPQILAAMVIKAYKDGVCKFSELLHWLEVSNPLKFEHSLGHKFYEYKLKKFLMSLAGDKLTYDYKSQANCLLENAELVLSNVTFMPVNSELLISMEIKIGVF
ncbi:HpaII family restriction endonuclease [Mucilaginibacter sp. HD30]